MTNSGQEYGGYGQSQGGYGQVPTGYGQDAPATGQDAGAGSDQNPYQPSGTPTYQYAQDSGTSYPPAAEGYQAPETQPSWGETSSTYAASPYSQANTPPAAQPGYPASGYQAPAAQPGYPATGYQPPAAQPSYPATGYQAPAAQPGYASDYQAPIAPYQQPQYASYPEPSGNVGDLQTGYYSPSAAQVPAVPSMPYGYQAAPVPHPSSTTAMILGIISLFVLPIMGPVAIFLGARGRREMAQQPGRWAPSAGLTVGIVTGIISTLFMALFVLLIIIGITADASGF